MIARVIFVIMPVVDQVATAQMVVLAVVVLVVARVHHRA